MLRANLCMFANPFAPPNALEAFSSLIGLPPTPKRKSSRVRGSRSTAPAEVVAPPPSLSNASTIASCKAIDAWDPPCSTAMRRAVSVCLARPADTPSVRRAA
eukprot:6490843-Amphidinium_carterae.1